MELAGKESCTGCGACAYVCPKKCISFKKDETYYDIAYPVIDEKQCINCGKCQKSCPALNPLERARRAWCHAHQIQSLVENSNSEV